MDEKRLKRILQNAQRRKDLAGIIGNTGFSVAGRADSGRSNVIKQTGSLSPRSSMYIGILAAIHGIYVEVPKESRPYDFSLPPPNRDKWPRNTVVTLEDLGKTWSGDPNNKRLGTSWEYAIKYGIDADNPPLSEQPVLREYLNQAIAQCPGWSQSDAGHEAVLWGGQKVEDIVKAAEETFGEDAELWTPGRGGPVKIKNHLEPARDAINKTEREKSLPESARQVWKADLFIKRQGTQKWFGVSVKHRPGLFTKDNHSGISLGVSRYIPRKTGQPEPDWDEVREMAMVQIPYDLQFGEGFMKGFNIVVQCLESIRAGEKEATAERFPNTDERSVADLLLHSQKDPVPRILLQLQCLAVQSGVDPSKMDRGQIQVLGDPANVLQPVPRIVPPDELR